jgi:hypothetical protein
MSTISAARQKRIDAAVCILNTTTGLRVPQAMILAGFSKSDTANKIVRQAVRRRKQQLENNARHGRPSPNNRIVAVSIDHQQGPPIADIDGPTNPKPKRKQKLHG